MAFSTSLPNGEVRKWSLGPVAMEVQQFSCVSTDTSGTVTAARLSRVDDVLVMGLGSCALTSAPSISGATVTLTFADPASACTGYVAKNLNGYILLFGR